MSNIALRKRRGSTSQLSTLTPAVGDLFVNTTTSTVVVGDGATVGGVPLALGNHVHTAATQSVAGFLSAADKTTLDGLSSTTPRYFSPSGSTISSAKVVTGQLTISAPTSESMTEESAIFALSGSAIFSSSTSYFVTVNCTVPGVHVSATPTSGSTFTVYCLSLTGNPLTALPVSFIAVGA